MTNTFNLEDFKKGRPAETKDGRSAQLLAIIGHGVPAKMLITVRPEKATNEERKPRSAYGEPDTGVKMENYYINGKFFPDTDSPVDLVMSPIP